MKIVSFKLPAKIPAPAEAWVGGHWLDPEDGPPPSRSEPARKFAGAAGLGAPARAWQDLEVFARCGAVLAQGAEDVSREWLGWAERSARRSLERLDRFARCQTVPDLVAAQSDLVQDALLELAQTSRRIAGLSAAAIGEVEAVVAERLGLARPPRPA